VSGTKAAGKAVATAAGKARVPLIAGGAVIAGVAGGAALRNRTSRNSTLRRRLQHVSLPRPGVNLDADKLIEGAKRMGAYGEQIREVASAVERTRKRSN
jgi:hypothetical protein